MKDLAKELPGPRYEDNSVGMIDFYDEFSPRSRKLQPLSQEQMLMQKFSQVTDEEKSLLQKLQPYDINSELISKLNR